MKGFIIFFCLVLFSGCSSEIGHFGIISNRNITLPNIPKANIDYSSKLYGSTNQQYFFLLNTDQPLSINEALNNAIDNTGADAMVDVKVTKKIFRIPHIYYRIDWQLEGYPAYIKP